MLPGKKDTICYETLSREMIPEGKGANDLVTIINKVPPGMTKQWGANHHKQKSESNANEHWVQESVVFKVVGYNENPTKHLASFDLMNVMSKDDTKKRRVGIQNDQSWTLSKNRVQIFEKNAEKRNDFGFGVNQASLDGRNHLRMNVAVSGASAIFVARNGVTG
uniref:Uncharacterized protein n=1 Tax=Romanomermis culicivorax TaxID=13658 RepID=A0A915IWE5_ROMCU